MNRSKATLIVCTLAAPLALLGAGCASSPDPVTLEKDANNDEAIQLEREADSDAAIELERKADRPPRNRPR